MSLHNLKPWIVRAQREQYAIGAFNANTMEQVQAIVLAAQAENAPVIIQISHHALQYVGSGNEIVGLRYMAEIGKVAAQSVSIPVALHLDHATENEILQAIGLGFTSVMFDGWRYTLAGKYRDHQKTLRDSSFGRCLDRSRIGRSPQSR